MKCMINNIVHNQIEKGYEEESIRRYLKSRYNISMSDEAVKERIKMLKMKYELK